MHFILSNTNCLKMSPAKKKGDASADDVEAKINEIITDGIAGKDAKMEVDYSETTDQKVC